MVFIWLTVILLAVIGGYETLCQLMIWEQLKDIHQVELRIVVAKTCTKGDAVRFSKKLLRGVPAKICVCQEDIDKQQG